MSFECFFNFIFFVPLIALCIGMIVLLLIVVYGCIYYAFNELKNEIAEEKQRKQDKENNG